MKRNFKFYLLGTLALVSLVGCEPTLEAPTNLALLERTLTWDEVEGATSYKVLLNDEDDYEATQSEFVLPDEYFGPLTAKVASVKKNLVSHYSEALEVNAYLTLKTPKNLRQEGPNLVMWDEVNYANGYVVKIDGVEQYTLTNSFTVSISVPTSVSVLANGKETDYLLSSPFSESITLKVPLSQPQNLAFNNNVLSWNAVSNANSYQILVNNEEVITTSTSSYQFSEVFVGTINFKVKAMSDDANYYDSLYSELNVEIEPLKLATPQNVYLENGILYYDAVNLAETYAIYHNGVVLEEVSAITFSVPQAILNESGSYLQVQARSSIHHASELSLKVYLGALEIANEADLLNMTNTGFYTLVDNIILTSPWTPFAFEGILNGGGYTISNIEINHEASDDYGFFTKLIDATISNLTLEGDIYLTSTIHQISFGGLAGSTKDSIIHNVNINVDLEVVSLNGIANVGGLFGLVDGGEITNSLYDGDILTTHAITGGLVGNISSNESRITTITNSGSDGSILTVGGEQSYVGGFIGYLNNNNAAITNSRSLVDVSGTSYLGGFVGYMAFGQITNSYSRGTLETPSETLVHAGGFVGRLEGYNNKIKLSIAMMTININQKGSYIFVGSFSGVTPGGSYGGNIYENCYYDSTLSQFDRIGNSPNGRGDGISGKTSSELLQLTSLDGNVWSLNNTYPMLMWETV